MKPGNKSEFAESKSNRLHKKLLSAGVAVVVILLAAAVYLSTVLLGSSMVYSGVYLDGVSLAGLDKTELSRYIENKYNKDLSSLVLSIYHKDYHMTVNFQELNVYAEHEKMVNKVYNTGRQGNLFKRLIDIYKLKKNHICLDTEVHIDTNTLDRIINEIYDNTYVAPVSPSLLLLDGEVTIDSGMPGYMVNKNILKERIIERISKLESGIVIVPVEKIMPLKIDADAFYNQIVREPRNASFRLSGGEIEIIPEIIGRNIDRPELISLISDLESKSARYPLRLNLPVSFIKPEITEELIKANLFRDVLCSYSTVFPNETENDRNRSVNIRLAVEAINGTILLPGDTFSFNEVVGQRTEQKGYLPANVYNPDGISPGIGGGICQVSSTLYNAALKANLKITERNPHIYMVAYVPLGLDATVSYGTQDLKFTNSTKWPIKIVGDVTNDNKVIFSIMGTKANPSLEVVLQSTVVKLTPYTTEYIDDNTIEKGSHMILQNGMNGAVVDTYIILKKGNDIVSNYKLYSTTYNMLPEIIHTSPG